MHLTVLWCYLTLLISITGSSVQGDNENELEEKPTKHNISKRETIVLFDNFPAETSYKSKPKVVYRRISNQRYSPKPRYSPPRTKYRSMKPLRKPVKKYKPTKYGAPSRKKRPIKPRYGPPKYSSKPIYGPPKKYYHQTYMVSEPVGFGEPPFDHYQDFSSPKQSFAEPPMESLNIPMIPSITKPTYDLYQIQDFTNPTNFDGESSNFGQIYKNWKVLQNDYDTSYDYAHKHPVYMDRDTSFEPSSPGDYINSYIEEYKFRELPTDETKYEKRKNYNIDNGFTTKSKKPQTPSVEPEIIVGGQYAEPPARLLQKSYTNDSPDDEAVSTGEGYINSDVPASATMSPYVNYKNSNLAFSPQNLNDAFGIVDKK